MNAFKPSARMLELADQARERYESYDRGMLTNLREELVKLVLTPGAEPEAYWLYQMAVQSINAILLKYGHDSTATATGGDQPTPSQGS